MAEPASLFDGSATTGNNPLSSINSSREQAENSTGEFVKSSTSRSSASLADDQQPVAVAFPPNVNPNTPDPTIAKLEKSFQDRSFWGTYNDLKLEALYIDVLMNRRRHYVTLGTIAIAVCLFFGAIVNRESTMFIPQLIQAAVLLLIGLANFVLVQRMMVRMPNETAERLMFLGFVVCLVYPIGQSIHVDDCATKYESGTNERFRCTHSIQHFVLMMPFFPFLTGFRLHLTVWFGPAVIVSYALSIALPVVEHYWAYCITLVLLIFTVALVTTLMFCADRSRRQLMQQAMLRKIPQQKLVEHIARHDGALDYLMPLWTLRRRQLPPSAPQVMDSRERVTICVIGLHRFTEFLRSARMEFVAEAVQEMHEAVFRSLGSFTGEVIRLSANGDTIVIGESLRRLSDRDGQISGEPQYEPVLAAIARMHKAVKNVELSVGCDIGPAFGTMVGSSIRYNVTGPAVHGAYVLRHQCASGVLAAASFRAFEVVRRTFPAADFSSNGEVALLAMPLQPESSRVVSSTASREAEGLKVSHNKSVREIRRDRVQWQSALRQRNVFRDVGLQFERELTQTQVIAGMEKTAYLEDERYAKDDSWWSLNFVSKAIERGFDARLPALIHDRMAVQALWVFILNIILAATPLIEDRYREGGTAQPRAVGLLFTLLVIAFLRLLAVSCLGAKWSTLLSPNVDQFIMIVHCMLLVVGISLLEMSVMNANLAYLNPLLVGVIVIRFLPLPAVVSIPVMLFSTALPPIVLLYVRFSVFFPVSAVIIFPFTCFFVWSVYANESILRGTYVQEQQTAAVSETSEKEEEFASILTHEFAAVPPSAIMGSPTQPPSPRRLQLPPTAIQKDVIFAVVRVRDLSTEKSSKRAAPLDHAPGYLPHLLHLASTEAPLLRFGGMLGNDLCFFGSTAFDDGPKVSPGGMGDLFDVGSAYGETADEESPAPIITSLYEMFRLFQVSSGSRSVATPQSVASYETSFTMYPHLCGAATIGKAFFMPSSSHDPSVHLISEASVAVRETVCQMGGGAFVFGAHLLAKAPTELKPCFTSPLPPLPLTGGCSAAEAQSWHKIRRGRVSVGSHSSSTGVDSRQGSVTQAPLEASVDASPGDENPAATAVGAA